MVLGCCTLGQTERLARLAWAQASAVFEKVQRVS